ncbi:MAG: ATP-binding protein [Actinomycetales bacterium]
MSSYRALVDVPPTLTAASVARGVVRQLLHAWQLSSAVDAAQLVVSEMVTNAVRHVGGEASFELTIEAAGDEIRLALADGSSVRPLIRELRDDSLGGRGIALIEALTERWGVEDHEGGKRVWVILRAP